MKTLHNTWQALQKTLVVIGVLVAFGLLASTALSQGAPERIDICHATGSHSNPYVVHSPAKNGNVSGHDEHDGGVWFSGTTDEWGDIIPPFDYAGGSYPGKNWTTEGQQIYRNGCELPRQEFAKIVAHKVVCEDESYLPNWGSDAGDPEIDSDTAADFVDESDGHCWLEEGWDFQWAPPIGTSNPGDNTGEAGDPWITFGPTDGDGMTMVEIDLEDSWAHVWMREVWNDEYVPFSYGLSGNTDDNDYSAEMYCHVDSYHYDNYDRVDDVENGEVYYCAAFNALECSDQEEAWADHVEGYTQGTKKSGAPITDINRTNELNTLGAPDWSGGSGFFSLGKDGGVVVSFDNFVVDTPGPDVSVHEATNGRDGYPEERAHVEVSQDGSTWHPLGGASSLEPGGVSYFDISTTGLTWIKYVRISDETNWDPHSSGADGFDVDAVGATKTTCDEPRDRGSIHGHKWYDRDRDGERDDEERFLPRWGIRLYDEDGLVEETYTDERGRYWFENLRPGKYRVCERPDHPHLPGEWHQSHVQGQSDVCGEYGYGYNIRLGGGEEVRNAHFGNYRVRGEEECLVDGYKYDVTGAPLSGWEIGLTGDVLYNNGPTTFYDALGGDNLIGSDITDENGYYCINEDQPQIGSNYNVGEFMQDGWTIDHVEVNGSTTPHSLDSFFDVFVEIQFDDLGDVQVDFYNTEEMIGLHGQKWNDENGDGIFDQEESVISGWGVELYDDEGLVATTTTDDTGWYWFTGIESDEYTVCEVLQDGWTQTYPNNSDEHDECSNGTLGHQLSFDDSQSIEGLDFGNQEDGGNDDGGGSSGDGGDSESDGGGSSGGGSGSGSSGGRAGSDDDDDGEVAGASTDGEVLQTSIIPDGAPATGAGGTATHASSALLSLMLLIGSLVLGVVHKIA